MGEETWGLVQGRIQGGGARGHVPKRREKGKKWKIKEKKQKLLSLFHNLDISIILGGGKKKSPTQHPYCPPPHLISEYAPGLVIPVLVQLVS